MFLCWIEISYSENGCDWIVVRNYDISGIYFEKGFFGFRKGENFWFWKSGDYEFIKLV